MWPTFLGAILLIGVFGIGNTLVDVSGVTLMQRAVPDEVLGRVFGALQSILVLGLAVGALVAPFLLDLIGTRATLIAFGALLPRARAPAVWRRLRTIDARAHVPAERIELLRRIRSSRRCRRRPSSTSRSSWCRSPSRAGETVFRQGDHGDRFYVVENGRCEIDDRR